MWSPDRVDIEVLFLGEVMQLDEACDQQVIIQRHCDYIMVSMKPNTTVKTNFNIIYGFTDMY